MIYKTQTPSLPQRLLSKTPIVPNASQKKSNTENPLCPAGRFRQLVERSSSRYLFQRVWITRIL